MKYLGLLILLLLACGTPQSVVTPEGEPETEAVVTTDSDETVDDAESGGIELSQLSDTYRNKSNQIPDTFTRIKVETEEGSEKDLFEGYRVQIYSGQDVSIADSTARWFRAWSDTTINGYQADTYTFFRSPNYRVHVGDFHDRDRAISYATLLKRRFRGAWVVYDRVNPWNVPADTVVISIK